MIYISKRERERERERENEIKRGRERENGASCFPESICDMSD